MTNKQLIDALSKLDPNATAIVNVKQYNKVYGKQLKIQSTLHNSSYEMFVDQSYGGCTITVHLPEKAIIANWPKEL